MLSRRPDYRPCSSMTVCMTGKLIVLYGINNLGKSTQAKLLVERLNNDGQPAQYLKYPVYDLEPSGPLLNAYLRQGNPFSLSPREAQLLYTYNRLQYEPALKEKLSNGINIVAEDYIGTGLAWGIGAEVDESFLKTVNSPLLHEDIAFLFDGERFSDGIEAAHKHEQDNNLTTKVRDAHRKLGRERSWKSVNANDTIEHIHDFLYKTVKSMLN